MQNRHSQGEWFLQKDEHGYYTGRVVCLGPSGSEVIGSVYEPEKNGSVVAAAPELLEALENTEKLLHGMHMHEDLSDEYALAVSTEIDKARAAIAKARGQ